MSKTFRTTLTRLASAAMAVAAAPLVVGALPAHAADKPATPASVRPALSGVFHAIRNTGSNLCLEPAGQSTAEFAAIVQQPCVTTGGESLAQGWQPIKVGTNHYRFVNQLSGYCFDAFDGAFNGARLLQGTCVAISNEEFNTGTSLPAVTKIESRVHFTDTGYCVDVPGGGHTPGQAMQIYRCNGTPAQIWVIGF
ncbi:MAG TPA: RICIN domain-containing protein [Kineosporiaceae bacterium]